MKSRWNNFSHESGCLIGKVLVRVFQRRFKMTRKKSGYIFLSILIVATCAQAQEINLELKMPSHTFYPGMPCKLNLKIRNHGQDYNNAQLYVALTVGTGE